MTTSTFFHRLRMYCRALPGAWQLFGSRERTMFIGFALLFVIGGGGLIGTFILKETYLVPSVGGSYREAIVGGPRFLNPALAPANDTDRDLVKLVFSGLVRYTKKGDTVPDLAERYTVGDEGKTYTFYLRENVRWHDGTPFNADDVLFTIRVIQDPDYQSPLRPQWQSVKVEKLDERTIRLTLPNAYAPFLVNATVGILPKHIWQDVPASRFPLAEENLQPIGTGPYRFRTLTKEKNGRITALMLERSPLYYGHTSAEPIPYIQNLAFTFSEDVETALDALQRGSVDAINFIAPTDTNAITRKDVAMHEFALPRYFAVFFNQNQSAVLADKAVREALEYGVDRSVIISEALADKAVPLFGPLTPGLSGYASDIKKRRYDFETAGALLDKAGWKMGDDGIRVKTETAKETVTVGRKKVLRDTRKTTRLEFSLLTANWPELEKTAEILKSQWERLGTKVTLDIVGVADIQEEFVRPRKYQALLFGEVLSIEPDPFSFWHSSQKRDPGLNLALYQNPKVDKILEEARRTSDVEKRRQKLIDFQKAVVEDIPAIFIYSPLYLYPVFNSIRGIEGGIIATPAERFANMPHWYVKTRRVWR